MPLLGSSYLFEAILLPFLALSLAAVGLNILTGYAGQVSLGSAAFMAVGAFAAYNFNLRIAGLPLPATMILAGITAAGIGIVFGLPSLRLRGFYLAVSTLAAQFFVQWALTKFGWFSNDNPSGVINAPPLIDRRLPLRHAVGRYLFSLTVVIVLTAPRCASRATRGPAAISSPCATTRSRRKVIGVPVLKTKLLAFAISLLHHRRRRRALGLRLSAHRRAGRLQSRPLVPDPVHHHHRRPGLDPRRVFRRGLHRRLPAPPVADRRRRCSAALFDFGVLDMSQRIVLGALIIVFLIAEPNGLVALWDRLLNRRHRLRSS